MQKVQKNIRKQPFLCYPSTMHYALNSKKFKEKLDSLGIANLSQFSTRTKLHRNTISSYLSGEKSVFATVFLKICEELALNPLELVEGLEEKKLQVLPDDFRNILEAPMRKYPNICFVLFGSRAKKTGKKYADWDIGLSAGKALLETKNYLRIKQEIGDAFENTKYIVDVVNLDAAPIWFLSELSALEFVGGSTETYQYFLGLLDGIKKRKEAA